MRPPSVAMVTSLVTIRLEKEAAALIRNGYTVHLICSKVGAIPGVFETVSVWHDGNQYRRACRNSDADIFHLHNQPDDLVECFPRDSRPVVLDVHDLPSVMGGKATTAEQALYPLSDAFLHVSEGMRTHFSGLYGNGKPDEVMYNYIPYQLLLEEKPVDETWRQPSWWTKYPGPEERIKICYEGLVCGTKEEGQFNSTEFLYYNHIDTGRELDAAGIEFHLWHTDRSTGMEEHKRAGIVVHETKPLFKLVHEDLSTFRWGLVGNTNRYKQWDIAIPNKMFEYMAAGIPIVVWNAKEAADFVQKHGFGIVVNSAKEIVERNLEAERCRENVLKEIRFHTMEYNIHKLESLYKRSLNASRS